VPQNLVQPPPIQRAILNRHHARRSNSSIAPKVEPGVSPLAPAAPTTNPHSSTASPKNRPTPSSHSASPTATTSYGSQHGGSPAASGSDQLSTGIRPAMPPLIKAPQPFPGAAMMTAGTLPRPVGLPPLQPGHPAGRPGAAMVQAGATGAPYYAAPAFQNHMEQLGKLTRFLVPLSSPNRTLFVLDSFREYRTGVRCRSRYDGGPRRTSRHPERSWPISRRLLWRRTPADVLILAHNERPSRCSWSSCRGTPANRRVDVTYHASRPVPVHDPTPRYRPRLGSLRAQCEHGLPDAVFVRHEQYEMSGQITCRQMTGSQDAKVCPCHFSLAWMGKVGFGMVSSAFSRYPALGGLLFAFSMFLIAFRPVAIFLYII
jgi:hypothetical protein